jgi:hypothetical protein
MLPSFHSEPITTTKTFVRVPSFFQERAILSPDLRKTRDTVAARPAPRNHYWEWVTPSPAPRNDFQVWVTP